jgi:hypothetical protein
MEETHAPCMAANLVGIKGLLRLGKERMKPQFFFCDVGRDMLWSPEADSRPDAQPHGVHTAQLRAVNLSNGVLLEPLHFSHPVKAIVPQRPRPRGAAPQRTTSFYLDVTKGDGLAAIAQSSKQQVAMVVAQSGQSLKPN